MYIYAVWCFQSRMAIVGILSFVEQPTASCLCVRKKTHENIKRACVYIYIYIERERDIYRERDTHAYIHSFISDHIISYHICICICIYTAFSSHSYRTAAIIVISLIIIIILMIMITNSKDRW